MRGGSPSTTAILGEPAYGSFVKKPDSVAAVKLKIVSTAPVKSIGMNSVGLFEVSEKNSLRNCDKRNHALKIPIDFRHCKQLKKRLFDFVEEPLK
jgi:hypothetical protein